MADRPLECNQCKKTTKVVYKELKGKEMQVIHACEDCPVINGKLSCEKKRLTNSMSEHSAFEIDECPRCHTTEDAIRRGCFIGCSECYRVFGPLLVEQLTKLGRIKELPKTAADFSHVSLHKGRSDPCISDAGAKSAKLDELNLALDAAVKGENFEQAAWLRDRINNLMEEVSDEKM